MQVINNFGQYYDIIINRYIHYDIFAEEVLFMNLLEIVIEKYRCRMVDVADKYGYTARETVEISQNLDRLLNIKMDLQLSGTMEKPNSYYSGSLID